MAFAVLLEVVRTMFSSMETPLFPVDSLRSVKIRRLQSELLLFLNQASQRP